MEHGRHPGEVASLECVRRVQQLQRLTYVLNAHAGHPHDAVDLTDFTRLCHATSMAWATDRARTSAVPRPAALRGDDRRFISLSRSG